MEPTRPRVLAIVDLDESGLEVARAARKIVAEEQGQLALAHIAHWDWGSSAECLPGILTPEAMKSLRSVPMPRLREMAETIGYGNATLLVAPAASQKRGIEELVSGWVPDILVIHTTRARGLTDGERLRINLPFVSAAPLVRLVQPATPAGSVGSRLGPLWAWLSQ